MIKLIARQSILAISLFFLAQGFASADTSGVELDKELDKASTFSAGVGAGIQYAGLVGLKVNFTKERHNLYGSVGVVGLGIGYDFAVSKRISFGVNSTALGGAGYSYSANINYHANSVYKEGFVAGVDVINFEGNVSGTAPVTLFISVGYRF